MSELAALSEVRLQLRNANDGVDKALRLISKYQRRLEAYGGSEEQQLMLDSLLQGITPEDHIAALSSWRASRRVRFARGVVDDCISDLKAGQ